MNVLNILTLKQMMFMGSTTHENLDFRPLRHIGGTLAPPYEGYSLRHLNQHGPMREVKDMTMEEIRNLETKYGAPIRSLK